MCMGLYYTLSDLSLCSYVYEVVLHSISFKSVFLCVWGCTTLYQFYVCVLMCMRLYYTLSVLSPCSYVYGVVLHSISFKSVFLCV